MAVSNNRAYVQEKRWWQSLNGFDFFIILGGVINLLVIAFLLGYWWLH